MHHLALAIAPHEHIRFCDSLLALAGWVRLRLDVPRTLDELHAELSREDSGWPAHPTFEQLSLAVTLLAAIGAVRLSSEDRVERVRP